MLSVLSANGMIYSINMAVRDIDLVNMFQEVGWIETYMCFLPLLFGTFLAAVTVVLHSWYIAPVASKVSASVLGLVVIFSIWGPVNAVKVLWSGIRYSKDKTRDKKDGNTQMVEEAKFILQELNDIYGETYSGYRSASKETVELDDHADGGGGPEVNAFGFG